MLKFFVYLMKEKPPQRLNGRRTILPILYHDGKVVYISVEMNEINAIFKYKPNINYCTQDLKEHSDPLNSSSVMANFGENGPFVQSEFDNISG